MPAMYIYDKFWFKYGIYFIKNRMLFIPGRSQTTEVFARCLNAVRRKRESFFERFARERRSNGGYEDNYEF